MPTTPLVWLALRAIAFYQRHLSPRKGFCCALHATSGGRSCSAYGYRAIARGGLVKGYLLLRRRFGACARAGRRAGAPASTVRSGGGLSRQRGFCDAGCDVGDCVDCGEIAQLGDCTGNSRSGRGCDWPWGRRKEARPDPNLDDYLNNEKALRERVRLARLRGDD